MGDAGLEIAPDLSSGDIRLVGCSQVLSDQLRFAQRSTTGTAERAATALPDRLAASPRARLLLIVLLDATSPTLLSALGRLPVQLLPTPRGDPETRSNESVLVPAL